MTLLVTQVKAADNRAAQAEARVALLATQVKAADNRAAQAEARATRAEERLVSQMKASDAQSTEMIKQVTTS